MLHPSRILPSLLALIALSFSLPAQTNSAPTPATPSLPSGSAVAGGDAPEWDAKWNLFKKIGQSDDTIQHKIDQTYADWTGKTYNGVAPEAGSTPYVFDYPGHDDWANIRWIGDFNNQHAYGRVTIEAQAAAMLIAVQMNDQPLFDRLWRYTKDNMQLYTRDPVALKRPGINQGRALLGWYTLLNQDGTTKANSDGSGSAPDGEMNTAAALYLAAGRWGNKAAPYDYSVQGDDMTNCLINLDAINHSVYTDWSAPVHQDYTPDDGSISGNQVTFYWGGPFTDPAYHTLQYSELFARVGRVEDRARWAAIAKQSRTYLLPRTCGIDVGGPHPNNSGLDENGTTHLAPYQTDFTGAIWKGSSPQDVDSNRTWGAESWRVSLNIGVDWMWWGDSNSSDFAYDPQLATGILNTLATPGGGYNKELNRFPYESLRYLNGKARYTNPETPYGTHGTGPVGCQAVLAACSNSPQALNFVRELWYATDLKEGDGYNRFLYVEGVLACAGHWRVWGADRK